MTRLWFCSPKTAFGNKEIILILGMKHPVAMKEMAIND